MTSPGIPMTIGLPLTGYDPLLNVTLRRWAIGAIVIAVAAAFVAAAASRSSGDDLERTIASFLKDEEIPGAVVAFGRGSEAPEIRAFGLANVETGEAMPPSARFRIASLSKIVTATAVMELVRTGQVSLNDRLERWTPELSTASDPRYRDITVRDLLRHSGGWDRDVAFEPIADPEAAGRELGLGDVASCASIAEAMLAHPLEFAPGERYAYSNLGYCWLERIIASAAGRPYGDAVRALVLAPRGAAHMQIGEDGLPPEALATHYSRAADTGALRRDASPSQWFHVLGGAGGWVASAEEIFRAISPRPDPAMLERPPYATGGEHYYGLGWRVWPGGDRTTLTHYGALPGIFSVAIRTSDGLAIVALFNGRPTDDWAAFRRLLEVLPAAASRSPDHH